ncbi:type II secretion system protein GspI, partial [Escherichia coli O157:H7]|nr:type II secretion system protein GspI [Escherichia coli O157:H7]
RRTKEETSALVSLRSSVVRE